MPDTAIQIRYSAEVAAAERLQFYHTTSTRDKPAFVWWRSQLLGTNGTGYGGREEGSPAAMNFAQMNPDPYNQMNGNVMRPPSSHPRFSNGQYPPQQLEAMARAQAHAQMPNGNGWQQDRRVKRR